MHRGLKVHAICLESIFVMLLQKFREYESEDLLKLLSDLYWDLELGKSENSQNQNKR